MTIRSRIMTLRCLAALLAFLLAVPASAGTPEEDLQFAQLLGRRGLDSMAVKVLDDLIASGDAQAKRYGEYGKALLTKERASIARHRFLYDLEQGRTPRVKREEVLALYDEAEPKIDVYVKDRPSDFEARGLLGELLMEHGEFLVGSDYPEDKAEEKAKLLDENVNAAEKLFERAITEFEEVHTNLRKQLPQNVNLGNPIYIRASLAKYNKATARLRWALLYPKGPKFNYRSEQAIEELDEFFNEHYDDLFGAAALLDLGRANYERGLRLGTDDAEIAIDYFKTLYESLEEDANNEDVIRVLAQAFLWYTKACNAIARADGALKKPQPVFYENTIRAGAELKQRLTIGQKHPDALRAMLNVADAYAATGNFDAAVSIAGDVLATARVERHRQVAKQVTRNLTRWVANVSGAGALGAGLLFQIGESLAAQDRTANAITFFEKAVAASVNDEDKERWAYPARLRIARAYRSDQRYYAAGQVAWTMVEEYLKSGDESNDAMTQVASEACNEARLAWKKIAEFTNRSKDRQKYDEVRRIFGDKFPGHPENADAAFSEMRELFDKGEYEEAAKKGEEIGPASANYWVAQRMIPLCYRALAAKEKDKAQEKVWHEKSLEKARALVELAKSKGDAPGAPRSLQEGRILVAIALASLERWDEALKALDDYLKEYPDQFVKKGLELALKIDAHVALGQIDKAEETLLTLRKKLPTASHVQPALYQVAMAMRDKYQEMGPGKASQEIASRAADYLGDWLELTKEDGSTYLRVFAEMLRDAHRWTDAGEAFEVLVGKVSDKMKSVYTLKAAEMKYKAAVDLKETDRAKYVKTLEETRKLFIDFLIPDESRQMPLLKKLSKGWLTKQEWAELKNNPSATLTTAEILAESSPPGVDGRWVAVRLIRRLHELTKPIPDPEYPNLEQYIPTWWEGAQLMLEICLKIAQEDTSPQGREAAKDGYGFAKKIQFQYPDMDGPERVAAVKNLEIDLKRYAR
jgi:hypothetical protein